MTREQVAPLWLGLKYIRLSRWRVPNWASSLAWSWTDSPKASPVHRFPISFRASSLRGGPWNPGFCPCKSPARKADKTVTIRVEAFKNMFNLTPRIRLNGKPPWPKIWIKKDYKKKETFLLSTLLKMILWNEFFGEFGEILSWQLGCKISSQLRSMRFCHEKFRVPRPFL